MHFHRTPRLGWHSHNYEASGNIFRISPATYDKLSASLFTDSLEVSRVRRGWGSVISSTRLASATTANHGHLGMMPLARLNPLRPSRPNWPEPEESVGRGYGEIPKTKFSYWHAKGPALTAYQKLLPDIRKVLSEKQGPVPNSDFVWFSLYMIGPSPTTAAPFLMFASEQRIQRRKAMNHIKNSKILEEFPGMRVGEWAEAPHIGRQEPKASLGALNDGRLGLPLDVQVETFVFMKSQSSAMLSFTFDAYTVKATASVQLRIQDTRYYLVPSHVFMGPPVSSTVQVNNLHDSDNEGFNFGDFMDDENRSEEEVTGTSLGSVSSSNAESQLSREQSLDIQSAVSVGINVEQASSATGGPNIIKSPLLHGENITVLLQHINQEVQAVINLHLEYSFIPRSLLQHLHLRPQPIPLKKRTHCLMPNGSGIPHDYIQLPLKILDYGIRGIDTEVQVYEDSSPGSPLVFGRLFVSKLLARQSVPDMSDWQGDNKNYEIGVDSSCAVVSIDLDFALCRVSKVSEDSYHELPDFMAMSGDFAEVNEHGTPVHALTIHGTLRGQIYQTLTHINLPYSSSYQEVYVAYFESPVLPGDSGVMVYDSTGEKVFGHVITGCADKRSVFVVPAKHVHDDIIRQLANLTLSDNGRRPEFEPRSADNFPEYNLATSPISPRVKNQTPNIGSRLLSPHLTSDVSASAAYKVNIDDFRLSSLKLPSTPDSLASESTYSRDISFTDHEKRFVLGEMIKASNLDVGTLVEFLRVHNIQPDWLSMQLPGGRNLNQCIGATERMFNIHMKPPPLPKRRNSLSDIIEQPPKKLAVIRPMEPQPFTGTRNINIQPRPPIAAASGHSLAHPGKASHGAFPAEIRRKRGRPSKADKEAAQSRAQEMTKPARAPNPDPAPGPGPSPAESSQYSKPSIAKSIMSRRQSAYGTNPYEQSQEGASRNQGDVHSM